MKTMPPPVVSGPPQAKWKGKAIGTRFVPPRLIATAHQSISGVQGRFNAKCADGQTRKLDFDGHITHGTDGEIPFGSTCFLDEDVLRMKIRLLPRWFDKTHKAGREFEEFLKQKNGPPKLYSDPELNGAIASDENFLAFSERVLNAPGSPQYNAGNVRIHQMLKAYRWDINRVNPIEGLGTLAFNRGWSGVDPIDAEFPNQNFADGLKIMIDAVAHVFVYVCGYVLYTYEKRYEITLLFELFDCFGLDDEHLDKFGFKDQVLSREPQQEGFTAWWQLQHQFNYAPLVTTATVTRTLTGPVEA